MWLVWNLAAFLLYEKTDSMSSLDSCPIPDRDPLPLSYSGQESCSSQLVPFLFNMLISAFTKWGYLGALNTGAEGRVIHSEETKNTRWDVSYNRNSGHSSALCPKRMQSVTKSVVSVRTTNATQVQSFVARQRGFLLVFVRTALWVATRSIAPQKRSHTRSSEPQIKAKGLTSSSRESRILS